MNNIMDGKATVLFLSYNSHNRDSEANVIFSEWGNEWENKYFKRSTSIIIEPHAWLNPKLHTDPPNIAYE